MFTKGEWVETMTVTGERLIVANNDDYEIICSNVRHWNAPIIKAAPDMYEALAKVETYFITPYPTQRQRVDVIRTVQNARLKAMG